MALGGEAFKWQARLIPDICPRINAATKYLIVGIAHTKRGADLFNHALVRRRHVAARRFVARAVGGGPIGIHVSGGQGGTRFGMLGPGVRHLIPPTACGGGASLEIE